jgi:hypothetical protein
MLFVVDPDSILQESSAQGSPHYPDLQFSIRQVENQFEAGSLAAPVVCSGEREFKFATYNPDTGLMQLYEFGEFKRGGSRASHLGSYNLSPGGENFHVSCKDSSKQVLLEFPAAGQIWGADLKGKNIKNFVIPLGEDSNWVARKDSKTTWVFIPEGWLSPAPDSAICAQRFSVGKLTNEVGCSQTNVRNINFKDTEWHTLSSGQGDELLAVDHSTGKITVFDAEERSTMEVLEVYNPGFS